MVADNCTDATVALAEAAGAEVVETVDNSHKKAGALNQVLAGLLPGLGDNDLVMVMDADTRLSEGFLSVAVRRFTDDRALMAVGGLFRGESGHGLIGQLQRNEYIRYEREVRRRRGRVFVLTGTASLFRSRALRTVADSRGRSIPGTHGRVYDTAALTEDNELTIAIKSLGGLMVSPRECTVVTELMPSSRTLWGQRLRWQRGALENLGAYGVTRQTFRYWAQQMGIGYGVIALSSFMLMMLLMALALDHWVWFPFWLGLGAVFMAGADRDRVAGRMAWPAARDPPAAGAVLRPLPRRGLRQGRARHLDRPDRDLEARRPDPLDPGGGPMSVQTVLSVLPTSILSSDAFSILAAFVAINTIMYAAVTVAKLLPRVNPAALRRGRYQRSETRSIYPDAPH